MVLAILEQDSKAALDVYDKTCNLPATATDAALSVDGYRMNGPLFPGSPLILCYRGLKVFVLKSLSEDEHENAVAFHDLLSSRKHPNIVEYTLYARLSKHYMIMALLLTTLEPISFLHVDEISQLWREISSALDFLHEHDFVFMDVKPSNICVHNETFVLIDLGSIVKLNGKASCTPAYIPSDFPAGKANVLYDWWMLAMTMAEKVDCEENSKLLGPIKRTTAELMAFLRRHVEATVYKELAAKLSFTVQEE
jgi:serine/threonine protein kinase